jgi:DNA (cytosine-5)-methyltransferase 1
LNMTTSCRTIKAVSLFCGCGGADLGVTGGFSYLRKRYHRTGVEIVHASDIDRRAVATYNLNFQHKAMVSDVHDLTFSAGFADIVIGGFPCQAFSTVNPTKKPHDKKNQLFWEMARIIDEIKPKVFIAENVKGFYKLSQGKYFKLAKAVFEKKGYLVFDKLLDASEFGVPQRRERVFMIGVDKKLKRPFIFPNPTHGNNGSGLKSKVLLWKVIDCITPPDPKYYFSERAVEGVKKAKPNMKRALAQDLNGQCLTVTSHLAKVSLNSRDPVLLVDPEKELYRRFTPGEAARIQSFPNKFVFTGSEGDAYRQIGNAVPPVVMWHIIRSVVNQIF